MPTTTPSLTSHPPTKELPPCNDHLSKLFNIVFFLLLLVTFPVMLRVLHTLTGNEFVGFEVRRRLKKAAHVGRKVGQRHRTCCHRTCCHLTCRHCTMYNCTCSHRHRHRTCLHRTCRHRTCFHRSCHCHLSCCCVILVVIVLVITIITVDVLITLIIFNLSSHVGRNNGQRRTHCHCQCP